MPRIKVKTSNYLVPFAIPIIYSVKQII